MDLVLEPEDIVASDDEFEPILFVAMARGTERVSPFAMAERGVDGVYIASFDVADDTLTVDGAVCSFDPLLRMLRWLRFRDGGVKHLTGGDTLVLRIHVGRH